MNYFLHLETLAPGKCKELVLELLNMDLVQYINAMFSGGRWTSNEDEINLPRKITVIEGE